MCVCVWLCVCARACMHVHMCACVCVRTRACTHVCVCVCVCVWCGVVSNPIQHSIKQGSIDFLPTVFTAKYAQYFSVFISLFLSPVSQNQPALV